MKSAFLSAALSVCTNAYAISNDAPGSYEAHEWRAPGPGDGMLVEQENTKRPLKIHV